jgi:hypothetical protein
MAQETFNTQFNFQGFNTLKADLREATQLYQQMLQSGTATTREMELQAQKVAELKDRLDDANDATRALTGAGRIQAFGRAITAVSGGFTALQGVIALTGSESEDLQKTMVKLQAAMSITMGLSQLEDFGNAMKNAARATGLQTVAMRAYTFVTNGATVATRAFRATLLSLGAGAILVGIGLLVNKFMELAQANKDADQALKDYQKTIENAASKGSAFVSTFQSQIVSNFEVIKKALKDGKESVTIFAASLGKDSSGKTILKNTEINLTLSLKNIKGYYEAAKKVQVEYLEEVANLDKEALESSLIVKEQEQEKALEQMKSFFAQEEQVRKTLQLSQSQKGTDFYKNLEKQLNDLQNQTAKASATYKELSAEIALIQQQIIGTDYTKRDFVNTLDQQFKEVQTIISDTNDTAEKNSKASFDKTVANYLEGRKEQLANEKDFNAKYIRLVSATAKTEEEIALEQFDNERKLREKEIQDEIDTNRELVRLYTERLKEKGVSDEERAEITSKLASFNKEIVNLELQLNAERAASDAEYVKLTGELADQRLAKEKETNDAILAEQERLREEFNRNLDLQLQTIDEFYERRKRKILMTVQTEGRELEAIYRDRDKIEFEIEVQKLERQIKMLKFLGMETEKQEFELFALKKDYAEREGQIRYQNFQKIVQLGLDMVSSLEQVYKASQARELAAAGDNAAKREEIEKKYFEKNKGIQIAETVINTINASVAAYKSLAGIPIVGPVLGAAAALAAIVFGTAKISEIRATTFQSSSVGGATPSTGSKFAMGGMLVGPSHSQGGMKTMLGELEGGEFVMNRIASQAFLPILERMNQTGQSNSERMLNPGTTQGSPIIKTYVVATDMDSALEKKRKIEKLARL